MPKNPLNGLIMRTAVVRQPGVGYIYAADPKKEAADKPHTLIFKYADGKFTAGEANYNTHSACMITHPMLALVDVSAQGIYGVNSAAGAMGGDLFDVSQPPPAQPRLGGVRAVATIAGQAHAVGLRGMVYRMDSPTAWARIDEGLPQTFNAQAAHGFALDDLYVVGREGQVWRLDGTHWVQEESPSSATFTCVTCAPDSTVYIGGHQGALIAGRAGSWHVVNDDTAIGSIWGVQWFAGHLYVSTMTNVYRLGAQGLSPVDFGDDPPKSCYQLSSAEGVMWSNGEFDLMSFDGSRWTRIV